MSGSVIAQGSTSFNYRGYNRVSKQIVTNQPAGTQWQLVHEGVWNNIVSLAGNFYNKGARCTVELKGGVCRLTSLWGSDPGDSPEDASNPAAAETPQDRFELTWEPEQISVFNLPQVIREAEKFVSVMAVDPVTGKPGVLTNDGAAAYKYVLETAARNGSPNPIDTVSNPVADFIWRNYLSKGVEYWEGARPIVRRIREYSLTYDINKPTSQVQMTTPVYSRAKLIQTFAIPANFANQIPLDPTNLPPHNTDNQKAYIWGWRFRSYSYGYDVGTRKVVESSEWDFAEWCRGLYTIIE